MGLYLAFIIPPLLLMLYAQWRVSSTFGKYSKIANDRGMTGLAHEVGHAVQHATAYTPLKIRNAIYPVASLGSNFGFILVFLGFILYSFGTAFGLNIAWAGVALFGAAVVFSVITLPVEFNASTRARIMLRSTGLASVTEMNGASAVLSAAALTYVAAMLQAVMQLLYFVMLLMGGRR
jgi:Zn-dependent membrane protease YugP